MGGHESFELFGEGRNPYIAAPRFTLARYTPLMHHAWESWTLAQRPQREPRLGPFELAGVLLAIFVGAALSQNAVAYFDWVPSQASLVEMSAADAARLVATHSVINLVGVLAFLVICVQWRGLSFARLGFQSRRLAAELTVVCMGLVVLIPLALTTSWLAGLIVQLFGGEVPKVGHTLLAKMYEADSPLTSGLLVFSAVMLAPIYEEIVYRGVFQTFLVNLFGAGRAAAWGALIVAAALFALVHLSAAPWQAMPSLFIVGLVLGYVYEATGSLWSSVLIHAGFNAFNTVFFLLMMRWQLPV